MSENENGKPEEQTQQEQPQQDVKRADPSQAVEGPCQSCGATMQYHMPAIRVFNALDVSSICAAHSRPDACKNCGAMYLPIFDEENIFKSGGVINFRWVRVKTNQSPLIVGGTDDAVKKAIAAAQFTEKIKKVN